MSKAWFETWFDTHYYHLLYRHRNEVEARQFIDALLRFLDPEPNATFIDIACGKGRHARYLRSQGFDVTGIDLSTNSIEEARAASSGDPGIHFLVHDIREPFPVEHLDYAVNLFTSFGYFDDHAQHQEALNHIHTCLQPGGRFVLDFLNTSEVLQSLKREDHQTIDGVDFKITRRVDQANIIKEIEVHDGSEVHHFEERVRAFTKDQLVELLERSGFEVKEVFGNYQLASYAENSPRVVIIAQKKA